MDMKIDNIKVTVTFSIKQWRKLLYVILSNNKTKKYANKIENKINEQTKNLCLQCGIECADCEVMEGHNLAGHYKGRICAECKKSVNQFI